VPLVSVLTNDHTASYLHLGDRYRLLHHLYLRLGNCHLWSWHERIVRHLRCSHEPRHHRRRRLIRQSTGGHWSSECSCRGRHYTSCATICCNNASPPHHPSVRIQDLGFSGKFLGFPARSLSVDCQAFLLAENVGPKITAANNSRPPMSARVSQASVTMQQSFGEKCQRKWIICTAARVLASAKSHSFSGKRRLKTVLNSVCVMMMMLTIIITMTRNMFCGTRYVPFPHHTCCVKPFQLTPYILYGRQQ